MNAEQHPRSLLFVPGSRPELFTKAATAGADLVVLDLEDAVAPAEREAAREAVVAHLELGHRAAVRVNGLGTSWHDADICALGGLPVAVMLAKAEPGKDLSAMTHSLQARGVPVIGLVETAIGVLDARTVAATTGVERLAFGSLDLAAELGVDPLDRSALAQARSTLVLASAAAGIAPPIDGVTVAIDDDDALGAEAVMARDLGFSGKLCIHPRQAAVVNAAFAPSPDEVAWATAVVDAADVAGPGTAVISVDGAMIDKPVLTRARRILARAVAEKASTPR